MKQIQQTLDENIFVEMKLRIKQVSLVERLNILPEKRESGLLNKKEMNEIDKGYKIIKNTEAIKENQNLIKICDLLKFLCLFYVKIGSCLDTSSFKSEFNIFFIHLGFFLIKFSEAKKISKESYKKISALKKQISKDKAPNFMSQIKETTKILDVQKLFYFI